MWAPDAAAQFESLLSHPVATELPLLAAGTDAAEVVVGLYMPGIERGLGRASRRPSLPLPLLKIGLAAIGFARAVDVR